MSMDTHFSHVSKPNVSVIVFTRCIFQHTDCNLFSTFNFKKRNNSSRQLRTNLDTITTGYDRKSKFALPPRPWSDGSIISRNRWRGERSQTSGRRFSNFVSRRRYVVRPNAYINPSIVDVTRRRKRDVRKPPDARVDTAPRNRAYVVYIYIYIDVGARVFCCTCIYT